MSTIKKPYNQEKINDQREGIDDQREEIGDPEKGYNYSIEIENNHPVNYKEYYSAYIKNKILDFLNNLEISKDKIIALEKTQSLENLKNLKETMNISKNNQISFFEQDEIGLNLLPDISSVQHLERRLATEFKNISNFIHVDYNRVYNLIINNMNYNNYKHIIESILSSKKLMNQYKKKIEKLLSTENEGSEEVIDLLGKLDELFKQSSETFKKYRSFLPKNNINTLKEQMSKTRKMLKDQNFFINIPVFPREITAIQDNERAEESLNYILEILKIETSSTSFLLNEEFIDSAIEENKRPCNPWNLEDQRSLGNFLLEKKNI